MGDGYGRTLVAAGQLVDAAQSLLRSPARVAQVLSGRPVGFDVVEPWLRPGDWELVLAQNGPIRSPVAAVRTGASIPAHIDGPAFSRRGIANKDSSLRRRPFTLERAVEEQEFQADVWLMRDGMKWLLFDLERSEVLRWIGEPITEEYEVLRRTFARHVPSVDFAIGPTRRSLREPVIQGTMLLDVPEKMQEHVCRAFIRDLAALVRAEGRREEGEIGVHSLHEAVGSRPTAEAGLIEDALTDLFGEKFITIPAHGDLKGSNVLVREEGDPVAIDFGNLSRGPFFYDALQVASVRRDLWAAGGFDEELGEVWEAAGLEPVRWDAGRIRLAGLARAPFRAAQRMRQTRPPFKALKRRVKAAQIRTKWERQAARLP